MSIETVEINITGIVQGVGFRPFLFNLARNHNLNGYVLNRGNAGVRLVLQGKPTQISQFVKNVEKSKPSISYIENIGVNKLTNSVKYTNLEIRKSEKGRGISLTLPPDVAVCEDCLKEMREPKLDRYYQYPFIACAVCGPRFTTVKSLPYDRKRSTMQQFPFCDECLAEYQDFDNRRFHAQTYACSVCGPNYRLYDYDRAEKREKTSINAILRDTAKRINGGDIAAVKGIGGVHLVCAADDEQIIQKLRKRKRKRKYKPFALMIPNLNTIEQYFKISDTEREIITSFRRPIVLLEKKRTFDQSNISDLVAPGLNNIGFMLPYTGIHYLIFNYIGDKPLIYTSGNKSNIPMGIENDKIINQLQGIADFFLLHNRTIYQRADDSVLRVHANKTKLIRRSRGYVPEYIPLPFQVEIPGALATGPELNSTGAVLRRNRIFPTQHIGNTTNLETFQFLKKALFHMKDLLQIKKEEIRFIAYDAHPAFISTQYARELSEDYQIPSYPVQHHYAHILALMAENSIKPEEKIIGISTDGVGFGSDGNIWGGEILLASYYDSKRLGHLEYQPMIGGDRCTKYPARMAASIILKTFGIDKSKLLFDKLKLSNDLEYGETELNTLINQYANSNNKFPAENIPLSSSTGRIFDTVSYLLGVGRLKTYRGEPAMRLEGLAARGNPDSVNLKIKYSDEHGISVINTSELIGEILKLIQEKKNNKADIAAKFQEEIGNVFARVAIDKANKFGITKIGLSGGVAYNYSFSNAIKQKISEAGLKFLEHESIPPGDAGISSGQVIHGIFMYKKEN
ncbi:MAG: putative carbamoyltransferase HypF [Promethearchaeota archaeon]|nr:MAG: putative carbamoyltransferase HypF [Candidatus Lokiarchaeota archaeon]